MTSLTRPHDFFLLPRVLGFIFWVAEDGFHGLIFLNRVLDGMMKCNSVQHWHGICVPWIPPYIWMASNNFVTIWFLWLYDVDLFG